MDDGRKGVMECSGGRTFQREDRTHTEGPGSRDSIWGGVRGVDKRSRHFTESQERFLSRTVWIWSDLQSYNATGLCAEELHIGKWGQSSRVGVTGTMDR